MEKLWDETDLAEFFKQSVLTVRRVRTTAPSRHPPYIRIGSSVRYDPGEVKRWLESKTVNGLDTPKTPSPTSSAKQTHLGAPTKAERVKKAKNALK